MRRAIIATLSIAAIVGAVGAATVWWRTGPTESQFAYLKEPRLATLVDQPVIVVEARGDPNVVSQLAFKRLYSEYFHLSGVSKTSRPPAPRVRWPNIVETPRSEWVGRYALPIPAGARLDAAEEPGQGLHALTETWTYGLVAEVLHVGPYSTEEPDIRRLHEFVASAGYRVVGDHEEEYVRGPGWIFMGDPERYLTIIRVRVDFDGCDGD